MDILLIDDDHLSLDSLEDILGEILGHRVTKFDNCEEALRCYEKSPFPLVITDIRMPGMNGIDLLRKIKSLPEGNFTDVIMITGYGKIQSAVEALRAGAYDYLQKPIDVEEFAQIIERVAEHQALIRENYELTHRFSEKVDEVVRDTKLKYDHLRLSYAELVGVGRMGLFSKEMKDIVTMAERLHDDRSLPVLIEGETGTGKEVIARLVHYGSGDVTTPFISINCSAISSNLFESELFGYEGSAFTGAKREGMQGKFEIAHGGTLFLDEIGDLPLDLQPKLLRALEEREIYRVGGVKKIKLDVRIICATNRNLQAHVENGAFRSDLFYRLNLAGIHIPPLRERKEAITPLAQMFLEQLAAEKKRNFKYISTEAAAILDNYSWPGNVRELKNTIERVVLLYDDIEVKPKHLGFIGADIQDQEIHEDKVFDPGSIHLPPDKLDLWALEDTIITKALKKFKGNKTKTADYLGITRSTLRSRLKN